MEPCLSCGAPVHPVAGRCKECRADLASLREERARTARREARQAAAAAIAGAAPTPSETTERAGKKPRWPHWRLAIAAVLVLGIGIVGGVLAQRLVSARSKPAVQQASVSLVDHSQGATPSPPAAGDPRDPGMGITLPPPAGGAAPPGSVSRFGVTLGETLCSTMERCGVLQGMGTGVCNMMAGQLVDPDADERVRRGECQFDPSAAKACIDAISGLGCNQAAGPAELLALASGVAGCAQALDCFGQPGAGLPADPDPQTP